MPMMSPRHRAHRSTRPLTAFLLAWVMVVATPAHGQDASPTTPARVPTSLHSVQLPITPVPGEIAMHARAGWIWMEGPTHRIVLERHVSVVLGGHQFHAQRANIWMNTLPGAPGRYQVYAIFEDLVAPDGSMSISAKELPVRGVIDTSGPISLRVDARFDHPPARKSDLDAFVVRTNALFAQRVLGVEPPANDATANQAYVFDRTRDAESGITSNPVAQVPAVMREPVFRPSGIFSLSIGDRIVAQGSGSDHPGTISATGGVVVQYQDPQTRQTLDVKAERMVVFLKPGKLTQTLGRIQAENIEGIYLEGGVLAGNADWTARAPKMYLDVARGRALMLDAVFWTVDEKTGMPLYVRADAVRQESRTEFSATRARIANTAFFEPDFTIGVKEIRVTLEDRSPNDPDPSRRVLVEGRSVTLNAGGVPIFWLPGFKGNLDAFPLRQVQVGDSNRAGVSIRTQWDLFSLLEMEAPPGMEADLKLEYFGERGFAFGVDGRWRTESHRGSLFSYLLPDDRGTDISPIGTEIERDGEARGIIAFNDLWRASDIWTVATQFNYISDEAFVPAFFDRLGRTSEDFATGIQIERKDNHSYLALEASVYLNDFIAAEHVLQSPGYTVDKIPELRFVSMTRDPLAEVLPGVLTYNFEARAGIMRLGFSDVQAREYGFTTNSLANDAFGTLPTDSLGDVFRGLGLDESSMTRLDTRHELTGQLRLGEVNVTPFLVGRMTSYDTSFDSFSPAQTDNLRYWGGGGVTLSTSIQKIDNDAESRMFDIHRIRHIIEPSLTVWYADSNFDVGDTPVFDDDVEDLLRGTMFRAAVDQTWQTKRGGPGRWRDADLLKIRTEYIWSDNDAGTSAIPEFFQTRPELSNPGEFIGASAVWQPTEVLGVAGEIIYNLDTDATARASAGLIIEHRPDFVTSIEYREIGVLGARYAAFTTRYTLTEKYALRSIATYNFDRNDFQTFNTEIHRRFQIGTLGVRISYNNIRSETSFGFVFRPVGARGGLLLDDGVGY